MRLPFLFILFISLSVQAQSVLDSALALFDSGKIQSAERIVDDFLASNSENGKANYLKGRLLIEDKKHNKAMLYLKKAVEYPFDEMYLVYNEMAYLEMILGHFEQAYDAIGKAMRLNKENHRGQYVRGRIFAKEDNYPAAIASYKKAIKLNDQIAEYYNSKASAEQASKNFAAACLDFKRAQELGYKNLEDRIKRLCN